MRRQINPPAFKRLWEAAVPGLKMFERGKSTQAQVLAEFQKHKKNFQFNLIGVSVL